MARFERMELSLDDWGKLLSGFQDRIVFQTPAWLSFLAESQNGEIVIAALREGNETLGYFSGLIVSKFGFAGFDVDTGAAIISKANIDAVAPLAAAGIR